MIYIIFLISILLHEFSHIIVAMCFGYKLVKFRFLVFGAVVEFKEHKKQKNEIIKNLLIYFSGPFMNFIICLISYKSDFNLKIEIFYTNLILGIFNLLPINPLDGGRIIKGVLHIFFGKNKAEKYVNYISFASLIFITFVASIMIYKVENIAIFLIVVVLWLIFINEDRIYRRKIKIYNLQEKVLK